MNLIGEHTDYNGGLALPFAISRGITVTAEPTDDDRITAEARDIDERDEFRLSAPEPTDGWRAFVRGTVGELTSAGYALKPCRLTIEGDLCLDPFAGSGTLGAVCRELGRRFVLVDANPEAVAISRARLDEDARAA